MFLWLQSVDHAEVALPITEAFTLFPDYQVPLDGDDKAALQGSAPGEMAVFLVVAIHGDPLQATVNLLAPIVVNVTTRLARQKVLAESAYAVTHPLFPRPAR